MKKLLSLVVLLLGLNCSAAVPAVVTKAAERAKTASTLEVECSINGRRARATLSGEMFKYDLGTAQIYYDGQTQWSYSPADKEVTQFTPTAAEVAESNPLSVLSRLDKDYNGALTAANTVRLTAVSPKNQIPEATVVFDPKSGWPTRMAIINGGHRVEITDIRITPQKTKKSPQAFKFKAPKGTIVTKL